MSGTKIAVAGNGSSGFSGDGGPAISATLSSPHGVALKNGELFIADYLNCRIRKVNSAGIITTVAGGGSIIEDGIPAVDSYLGVVRSVTVAADGTFFISGASYQIARIDPDGRIWTLVGGGCSAFGGDGGPAAQAGVCMPWGMAINDTGDLLFSDSGHYRIRKIDGTGTISSVAGNLTLSSGGDGGSALQATMSPAGGLAVDGNGNVLVADTHNQALRVVSVEGVISTTFATNDFVTGVAVDPFGVQYILTTFRLFRRTAAGHTTVLVLSGGMRAVATDSSGNVFVTYECGVSRVLGDGSFVPVVDLAPITDACELEGLAIDQRGNFYIANGAVHKLFKADVTGNVAVFAGTGIGGFSGDGGPALAAKLMRPVGIAVDPAGNVYIADSYNSRVRMVNKKGIIATIAGTGVFGFNGDTVAATLAQLTEPRGLAVGGNSLFLVDQYNRRVRQLPLGAGSGKKH